MWARLLIYGDSVLAFPNSVSTLLPSLLLFSSASPTQNLVTELPQRLLPSEFLGFGYKDIFLSTDVFHGRQPKVTISELYIVKEQHKWRVASSHVRDFSFKDVNECALIAIPKYLLPVDVLESKTSALKLSNYRWTPYPTTFWR